MKRLMILRVMGVVLLSIGICGLVSTLPNSNVEQRAVGDEVTPPHDNWWFMRCENWMGCPTCGGVIEQDPETGEWIVVQKVFGCSRQQMGQDCVPAWEICRWSNSPCGQLTNPIVVNNGGVLKIECDPMANVWCGPFAGCF